MKTQIFAGIAFLIAGVYTVEREHHKEPEPPRKEVRVVTTEELIENSSLNKLAKEIEEKQDSVSYLVREKVRESVVDSVIIERKDTEPKTEDTLIKMEQ